MFARAIAKGACLARPAVCFMLPIDGVGIKSGERDDGVGAEIDGPLEVVVSLEDSAGSSVNGDGNGARRVIHLCGAADKACSSAGNVVVNNAGQNDIESLGCVTLAVLNIGGLSVSDGGDADHVFAV